MESILKWLSFSSVATCSAVVFYLLVILYLLHETFREWINRVLAHPIPSTNQQINALDSYRGLAAALVAIAHMWHFSQPIFNATQTEWWWFLAVGAKAVPIFVILSGFLIFRSLKRVNSTEDLQRYVIRRFLRIYPVYLFAVILGLLIGQIAPTIPNVISEVFMLRVWDFPRFMNPPAWSLYIEVLFYALLPIWMVVFRKKALLAAIVCFLIFLFSDSQGPREMWLWKYFLVGIIASELSDRIKGRVNQTTAFVIFLIGCVLLRLDFLVDGHGARFDWFSWLKIVPKNLAEYSIGLAVACVLILMGTLNSQLASRLAGIRPLRILGAISYSLFLLHPFFILAIFPDLKFAAVGTVQHLQKVNEAAPAWFLPFVMFPGVLTWAMVGFICLERPFLRFRPPQSP